TQPWTAAGILGAGAGSLQPEQLSAIRQYKPGPGSLAFGRLRPIWHALQPDLRQKRDTGGVLHVPPPGRDQPAGVRPTVRSEGADRGGIWCRAGMAAPAQPQGLPYPVLPSGGWL